MTEVLLSFSVLQIRKAKLREVGWLAQAHTAYKAEPEADAEVRSDLAASEPLLPATALGFSLAVQSLDSWAR